ncbi:MAG: Conserved exported protein of unknown function [Rickettsiaceae bacterium]|jgi:hypothetical protein|nr:Conserved exported protein of unknown function [Rickettsiaceae bacterium]
MKQLTVLLLALIISNLANATDTWPRVNSRNTSVDIADISSSGQSKDGKPAINNPQFIATKDATNIKPSEPVISLRINQDIRAYPLRVLMWHGIVNDVVDNTPVAITYDPLTNTSIVFDRRLDGKTLEFSNTGKLYNSNMIMYDKETESWWQQYTGKSIAGQLNGKALEILPSRVESLALFYDKYPEAKVLVPNDPSSYSYGINPYIGYDTYFPLMYKGKYNKELPRMEYLVVVGNQAWPLELLKKKEVIQKDNLQISIKPYQNSALNSNEISLGRDLGNVIVQRKTENGDLVEVPYLVTFAFAFHAFQPDGVVNSN